MQEQFTSPTLELIQKTELQVIDGRAVNPACTVRNINNLVREAAAWLAQHPDQELPLPFMFTVMKSPDEEFQRKFTHAYVRNTANRVPEAAAAGRVKVAALKDHEFGDGYLLTFAAGDIPKNRNQEKKSKAEFERGVRHATRDIQRKYDLFGADLSFLADESVTPLQAALNVQAQFKALMGKLTELDKDTEQ